MQGMTQYDITYMHACIRIYWHVICMIRALNWPVCGEEDKCVTQERMCGPWKVASVSRHGTGVEPIDFIFPPKRPFSRSYPEGEIDTCHLGQVWASCWAINGDDEGPRRNKLYLGVPFLFFALLSLFVCWCVKNGSYDV